MLEPYRDATVSAVTGGEATAIGRREGAVVQRGDLVVGLDSVEAGASLEMAKAGVSETEAMLTDAKRRRERVEALGTKVSEAEREVAILGVTRAEAAFKRAQANKTLSVAALRHKRLTAPFGGIVTRVYPNVGELLVPGAPAFRVSDTSKFKVEVGVSSSEAQTAKNGQFSVMVDGVEAAAHFLSVSPVADKTTHDWPLTLEVVPVDGLTAGAAAVVTLSMPGPRAEAMVLTQSLSDGSVWVVREGAATKTAVEVVVETAEWSLVNGVDVGAAVVKNPVGLAAEGPVLVLASQ